MLAPSWSFKARRPDLDLKRTQASYSLFRDRNRGSNQVAIGESANLLRK
jgi:hypothetical protein